MIVRIAGELEAVEATRAIVWQPTGNGGAGCAREVLIPAYLAERLEREGVGNGGAGGDGRGVIELHTLEVFESVGQGTSFVPRLIGFATPAEREFFELLTTVKGLGAKRALRAMAIEPGRIARWIAERDSRGLTRLPEIGPKLAEALVHELKNKVDRFVAVGRPVDSEESAAGENGAVEVKPRRGERAGHAAGGAAAEGRKGAEARTKPAGGAPPPPVRATIDALIALGETPLDAERMVMRAVERARAAGGEAPSTPEGLLAASYAAR